MYIEGRCRFDIPHLPFIRFLIHFLSEYILLELYYKQRIVYYSILFPTKQKGALCFDSAVSDIGHGVSSQQQVISGESVFPTAFILTFPGTVFTAGHLPCAECPCTHRIKRIRKYLKSDRMR